MTTAGDNGVPEGQGGGAPQDDDPFGYLYRPADGSTGQPAEPQQGVPRTSYNRPMEVGRAQYGQPYPQGGPPRAQQQPYGQPGPYGQQPVPQQQAPYGQPGMQQQAEYGVPTQQTRYAEHSRPQPGEERQSSGRSRGAVIGAVAVVAAIAIGAGIALSTGDPDGDKNAKGGGTTTTAPPAPSTPASSATSGTASPSASAGATNGPSTVDAGQLQGQNAPSGNSVKGAKSADGSYLTLQQGGSVTWNGQIATAGTYKLSIHYNNPGGDVKGAASVNGKDWPSGVTYKNYNAGKDPSASWFTTFILPQFQAGQNSVTFMPPSGAAVLIDQIVIEPSS
ncbi:carbohydrate-binding protein [Kitasatospora sp. NPDC048296]|uniref:carbohydrate-binding protein n=1 Tax=Kitasatospora sp. NPDC048296 TaxID=3364048 RepID=UPI003711CE64